MSIKRVAFVGAGQLGLMLAQAGSKLGISFRSAGVDGSCAFASCESFTKSLDDEKSINEFIKDVDVFTFESEHEGLDFANKIVDKTIPIYPSPEFVRIAGDRLLEKSHLGELQVPTAPFVILDSQLSAFELGQELANIVSAQMLSPHGVVVKTRHGGYDGKGQWVIRTGDSTDFDKVATEIVPALLDPGCIVEGLVDFSIECSILATRAIDGEMAYWPLTHNIHENSILKRSHSPISNLENIDELGKQAIEIVTTICETNNYVGTIAVECFVTETGLVVNEIAPRVHNSGHWTIEGSKTSQFEQHVRAICGLELGPTDPIGVSTMINLIGRTVDSESIENLEDVYLHWYGKEVRPGRKVGHITVVGDTEDECYAIETLVLEILETS